MTVTLLETTQVRLIYADLEPVTLRIPSQIVTKHSLLIHNGVYFKYRHNVVYSKEQNDVAVYGEVSEPYDVTDIPQ